MKQQHLMDEALQRMILDIECCERMQEDFRLRAEDPEAATEGPEEYPQQNYERRAGDEAHENMYQQGFVGEMDCADCTQNQNGHSEYIQEIIVSETGDEISPYPPGYEEEYAINMEGAPQGGQIYSEIYEDAVVDGNEVIFWSEPPPKYEEQDPIRV